MKHLGMILLGIWLIVDGLMKLFNFSFPYSGIILAVIAIIAGILIIIKR